VSPWKVILATMVIFGCGVVTGGLLMKTELPTASSTDSAPHISTSTNQPPALGQFQRPEFLRRMQKQLDLTPSQNDDIVKIVKASEERTRPLWDQISPSLRQEMKRLREEIRKILTPDQQKKYDELLKSHPRKADAAAGRRPPPESPAATNTP
jgi:Spy/CpxP family protein refolding chaperone